MKKQDVTKLKKKLENLGVRFIDLKYPSLIGNLHHITVPFERFDWIIESGVGVDGSSLPGYKLVEQGDMLLFPDLSTLFFDPFFEQKTASFLCSIHSPDKLVPYRRDPRNLAMKTAEYVRKELNVEAYFLTELEFYMLGHCNYGEGSGYSFYEIGPEKEEAEHINYPIRKKGGYHVGPPQDNSFNIRNSIIEALSRCGIKSKYHHHEVGEKGQVEIELVFEPLAKAADDVFMAKYLIKCVSQKYGKWVTFMPKPFFDEPGNGMHFHQYLGRKNRSLFYSAGKEYKLSETALNYIGGILRHSRALCAITNPSTNSYKRLIPGFEAPTYTDFAYASRTTAIRIPGYLKNKRMLDVEYRIPDAIANPYLAIPAVVLAGIDGIKNKTKPEQKERLPSNMYEAIGALKKDHEFLMQGEIFSMDLLESWIEVKTKQLEEVHIRPHPHEFTLYFGA
ncbi:MAG: glutamine synthetase beta-grasp domain-containing protein [candidate division WOR-3 bacterium]|nr:MAG: glutamine synthetase beta-grasp domain-containing protein [candidate division WOR-3 bacterium]